MDLRDTWGYLVPYDVAQAPIGLRGNKVTVGRDPQCAVTIEGKQLGIEPLSISRNHFQLLHGADGTILQDESTFGTFVNGQQIGRGRHIHLRHAERIDIVKYGAKVFTYFDLAMCGAMQYPKKIIDKFMIGNQLGSGGFGKVFLVIDRVELKRYALKVVKNTGYAKREPQILQEIKHPCLVEAHNAYEDLNRLYLVLEYVAGGDLSQWVNNRKLLSEKQAKLLFFQLALAVQYLHKRSITHRDLKPQNILVVNNSPHTLIKVTDFGIAKDEDLHSIMKTCAGTVVYMAPEATSGSHYTSQVDIWSMGVILFYSLVGILPFYSQEEAERAKYRVTYSTDEWRSVSSQAQDLVKRMLESSPKIRANINEVVNLPWLQDEDMKVDAHNLMGIRYQPAPAVGPSRPVVLYGRPVRREETYDEDEDDEDEGDEDDEDEVWYRNEEDEDMLSWMWSQCVVM